MNRQISKFSERIRIVSEDEYKDYFYPFNDSLYSIEPFENENNRPSYLIVSRQTNDPVGGWDMKSDKTFTYWLTNG